MFADSNLVYGTIVVSPDDKILVVKGRKSGKWSFPKGHSYSEETELECALRETYEETGLQLSEYFQRTFHLSTGNYFLYSYHSEPQCKTNDTNEIQDIKWASISELKTMRVNIDINTFLRTYPSTYSNKKYFPSPVRLPSPIKPDKYSS
jgi:mRNA-decapping enzyme subunit 2